MVTREYECERHGYFEERQSITAPSEASCPECGRPATRVLLTAPAWGFGGKLAASGGIPNFHTAPAEYSEWQAEGFRKANEDLHPANVGKSVVTEESYAPKERLRAVREKKG